MILAIPDLILGFVDTWLRDNWTVHSKYNVQRDNRNLGDLRHKTDQKDRNLHYLKVRYFWLHILDHSKRIHPDTSKLGLRFFLFFGVK